MLRDVQAGIKLAYCVEASKDRILQAYIFGMPPDHLRKPVLFRKACQALVMREPCMGASQEAFCRFGCWMSKRFSSTRIIVEALQEIRGIGDTEEAQRALQLKYSFPYCRVNKHAPCRADENSCSYQKMPVDH